MLKFIEKILNLRFDTWDIMSLKEKYYSGAALTEAECNAVTFLEEVGEYMNYWHPIEKWKKPYGSILNEDRSLH